VGRRALRASGGRELRGCRRRPLYGDDYARLRRAVARYQRNHTAAPKGYPAGGLGALLHLGALAGVGELPGGPRTLRFAVGALDQLSRRMRAIVTADSATHAQHASQRARRRREPPPRAATRLPQLALASVGRDRRAPEPDL
jgi:hypothetical protein